MENLVGYQGIEGSNSHRAAQQMAEHSLSPGAQLFPMGGSAQVIEALWVGRILYGVMAFSTDVAGAVEETKRACANLSLTVVDHCRLHIAHHLFVRPDFPADGEIAAIASHPEALRECRRNLLGRFNGVRLVEAPDTASAARMLAQGALPDLSAALCSVRAGERFELRLYCAEMQDLAFNGTDFLLVRLAGKSPD